MHPLITTAALELLLQQEVPPTLLDVRWRLSGPPGRQDYDRGHVPGAVFVDLESELASPPGAEGRHPLPEPAQLEGVLRAAGVDRDRPVVVYDDGDGSAAARAWWLLRWAGHGRVSVLDGGYAAWVAEGLPVAEVEPRPRPGDFRVRPGCMPVVDAQGAARLAADGHLLDARAPERYRGEHEPVDAKAGHIPGAINAPFADHVVSPGNASPVRWRSPAELAERFARMGVTGTAPVGAYCGSGVTACSVLLALEHAGVSTPEHPAVLYAGSWSHWSRDPQRPVATGAEPG
ncbi:thiosulfate/3-mercaptopyruvate sulfurtransferase [Halopolyspora algeriensis]|uniref:Thiosulfate/3-mercaptopyruvate sulfurtransferase n=1 Tax=Halopolyspora algeriensis TaxID=1500506 RepID=A0A368VSA2_9ACTN|nr:sulfurtransferase [Halopolyspora algeriensis]RCW44005.1 thiosulfate/3-mercaptopyruvate sulfurtransferase [Halopolyspora algeriensis]TQM53492.1 thiosulfate/3-mercaptopyruvate sulfurtransferase [Halopolyspora algeriensis]